MNIRKHRMYGAWAGMVNRCHNPNNSSYARYGAKGIFVCHEWRKSFRQFLADMGERPEGKTLDRIDVHGPYAPSNCRWATIQEQRRNISAEGDANMRAALSRGVKQYWEKWRQTHVPVPNRVVTRSNHKLHCKWCAEPFDAVRDDATFCSLSCGRKARYSSRKTTAVLDSALSRK